jgi:CHAT domain-containing protein
MVGGRACWRACAALMLLSSVAARGRTGPCDLQSSQPGGGDRASACGLLRRGFHALDKDRLRAAAGLFQTALERADRNHDAPLEAQADRGISDAEFEEGHYPAARAAAKKALGLFSQLGDADGVAAMHEALGQIAAEDGDGKLASSLFGQADAEFQSSHDARGRLHVLLDECHLNVDKPEETALLLRAESLARSLGDNLALARLAHLSGDLAFARGDLETALSSYRRAVGLYESGGDQRDLARVFTSLGRLYRQLDRLAPARRYYRSALGLERAAGDAVGTLQALNAIAITYDNEKNWTESLRYYRAALALARTTGSPRVIRFAMGNLGTAYMEMGQPARAIPILRRVASQETSNYIAAYRYQALSKAYLALNEPHHALAAVNQAIRLRSQSEDQDSLVDSFTQRALVLARLGENRDAVADTERGLKILESIRLHLPPNDYMKRGFGEEAQKVYDVAVEIRFSSRDFRGAAEAGEQGRARAFLDLLATRRSAPRERASAHADGSGPPALAVRADSTSDASAFSASEMVGVARRLHSTILSYWTTPEALYVIVVDESGTFHGARVSVGREELQELIARATSESGDLATRRAARVTGPDDPWRQLDRILIEPVSAWLPGAPGSLLTIIPHGPLFRLPFAALRDRSRHYLVERYATHYLPAAAVFRYTARNAAESLARAPSYLLIADTMPARSAAGFLPPLFGAGAEVDAIAAIIGPRHRVVLDDRQDRVASVTAAMAHATVIHIATHAVMDDAHPLHSFLVLAPEAGGGSSPREQGRLTAAAIYGLHIPAGLVVLSACRTMGGQITGDGVMGMSRAFFAAGTASLLATEWNVADEPTRRLVVDFYRRLLAGENKAQALRDAQLEMIADLRAGKIGVGTPAGRLVLPEQPEFWAAFALEGNP